MNDSTGRINIAPTDATSDADWACATHVGLLRLNNEDYLLARPRIGLWIVCDGLGGHGRGDEASRLAAESVAEDVERGEDLRRSILRADARLRRFFGVDEDVWPAPGTTIVALRLTNGRWTMAWVGDSRGFVWDAEGLRQVTRDHSRVQQMVDEGLLTPAEARGHPWRNVVSQAVGLGCCADFGGDGHQDGESDSGLRVDVAEGELTGDQAFLLATDGLADADSPDGLARRLRKAKDPAEATERLVKASLDAGGADNVSVCVVGWRR